MQPDHQQRYTAALEAYRFQRRGEKPDAYWSALLLIATATEGLWEKVQPYLEIAKGNAWLGQLFAEVDISGGERRLMNLARNLFNGETLVDVGDLINTLDADMWQVAIEAVRIRRGES